MYSNIFSKGYTENWSREISVIDSVLKNNPEKNRKKIGNFYKNIVAE